jgi:Tetratricopeptide repeat
MMMNNLVAILGYEGHYAESEKVVRQTLDIQRRVLGPAHPDPLMAMNNLAVTMGYEGRYVEAEKLMKQTLDIERRVLGPAHPSTARSIYDFGCLEARQSKRDEALSLLREAVDHGLPHDVGIDKDPDLKSLHGDPHFDALVAHAKDRAAAAQKPN